ncbi:MAG: hypothetical protein ACR652_24600 [Methylocystis sp.]|uniref:hypothetical protein n=1 Tax=Methylocystis sp. TaxID=1911079 RepID=UPI003DA3EBEB
MKAIFRETGLRFGMETRDEDYAYRLGVIEVELERLAAMPGETTKIITEALLLYRTQIGNNIRDRDSKPKADAPPRAVENPSPAPMTEHDT